MSRWLDRREALMIVAMVLGLAYFYLIPWPVLALPGLICFGLLAWKRLDIALALLPLTFPFWYVPKRLFDNKVFPLSEIILAVCALLAITQLVLVWRRQSFSPRAWLSRFRSGIDWLIRHLGMLVMSGTVLFVIGVSLGVLVARRRPEALRAWRWEIAEPLVYFVLLLCYGRSRRAITLSVWSFLGGALLVAALAVVQVLWLHVTFKPITDGNRLVHYAAAVGGMPRTTAIIYGSANSLGAWLARALPLAVALACAASTRRSVRIATWILAFVYLLALFWSDSRGAWVAAIVTSLLVVAVLWRAARAPLVGLAAAAVIVAIWQRDAIANALLLGHGASGEVRALLWLASWHIIRDHLFLGIGPDQFLYYYSPRYTPHPYWIPRLDGQITPAIYQPDLAQPHNLLLDLWQSGGLLALIGFVLLLVGIADHFRHIWQSRMVWQSRSYGPLALGLAASILAGLIHGMVDSAYFSPDLAMAFWWATALLILIQLQVGSARKKTTEVEGC
jgi:putative inorganic carbon (hco3(-)) transporter